MLTNYGFEFLNPFGHSFMQFMMPLSGHSSKITRTVITSYTIEMMNNPIFRKLLAMCLFPNYVMFKRIPLRARSVTTPDKDISTMISKSSAFPMRILFWRGFSLFQKITFHTVFRRPSRYLLPAIYTKMGLSFREFSHEFKPMFVKFLSFVSFPIVLTIFRFMNDRTIWTKPLSTTGSFNCFITSLANQLTNHALIICYPRIVVNSHISEDRYEPRP